MDKSEWENFTMDDDEEPGADRAPPKKDEIRKRDRKKADEGNNVRKMDLYLDSMLSRVTGTYEKSADKFDEIKPRVKTRIKKAASTSSDTIKKIDAIGDGYAEKLFQKKFTDTVIDQTVKHPWVILITILVLTAGIGFFGIAPKEMGGADFQSKIHGEFDVYLPQGHETKEILDEVNEEFSTNFIIVLVQTNNSRDFDDPKFGYADITDRDVLVDFDNVEESEEINPEQNNNEYADDGVLFMLSISVVIKVANSTPPRAQEAFEEEINQPFIQFPDVPGGYTLPVQARIDQLIEQMPDESKESLLKDTNNDGIYDTGVIIIGITADTDQVKLVKKLNKQTDKAKACTMTVTGPIPMTQRMTARTYEEFIKVLPAAVILVGSVLVLFHRNFKILWITGIPVMCSLGITYGFLGLAVDILTPQVVLIAPILIALGVAYGLYILNRYADEKDIEDPEERVKKALKTTGRAVFLSAITTAIGFSSLMFMNMIPLQVIGLGLSLGIIVCYIITILIVPSLIIILKYEKKVVIKAKDRIGNVPINNRKKIVVVALVISIVSGGLLYSGFVTANMDFIKMAPQDEEVIKKMRLYSDIFGGGQPGMILVKGTPSTGPEDHNNANSMKDYDVLKEIDALETAINGDPYDSTYPGIKNANALGIIDIMKIIKVPAVNYTMPPGVPAEVEELLDQQLERIYNTSFWDALPMLSTNPVYQGKSTQQMAINIFYNTITPDIRSLFISMNFARSFLLIDMPAMDVVATKKAVDEVNLAIENFQAGSSTTHLTGFAAILVAVNEILVYNSVTSTVMALALVFIILTLIFRSLKYASLTMIPVAMVVWWQPVVLVSIGILGTRLNPQDPVFTGDLNLFSAIIGSIIVGIGIDFGVHMTERIRERGETIESVRYSVATSGMSFVEATATTIAGLSAVFLILIPAIQEFIILVILLLICSVLGALLLLPAIYTLLFRRKAALAAISERREEEGFDEPDRPGSKLAPSTLSGSTEMSARDTDLYGPEGD